MNTATEKEYRSIINSAPKSTAGNAPVHFPRRMLTRQDGRWLTICFEYRDDQHPEEPVVFPKKLWRSDDTGIQLHPDSVSIPLWLVRKVIRQQITEDASLITWHPEEKRETYRTIKSR